MRLKIKTLLFISLVHFNIAAQCDCNAALSADLLNISNQYNEGEFRDFLYQYFKSSKAERKDLKKKSSNSFGLKAVIDGLPLEFGSDTNSKKESKEFYSFEQEVIKNNYVSNEIIESISTKYFGDNQLKAYIACLNSNCGTEEGIISETGGDPFDIFYVRIIFNNSIRNAQIRLKTDVQYVGCSPVYGLAIRKGILIKNGQDIVQYFKRNNPDKVATINVAFEDGINAKPVILEKKTSNSSLPIGSIIISTLSFSDFHSQVSDKAFTSEESIWAPCDGRKVNGSTYANRYQRNNVPDLRGQFIRGNYTMGGASESIQNTPNGSNPRDEEYQQNGYTYQNDMTKSHSHSGWIGSIASGNPKESEDRLGDPQVGGGNGRYPVVPKQIESVGGSETRPKNMYVFYYIRIN